MTKEGATLAKALAGRGVLLATERADRLPAIRNVNPIKITLDLYSHWIPEMEDFTADARDEIF